MLKTSSRATLPKPPRLRSMASADAEGPTPAPASTAHPFRAHSMPWAPAITCLPFLDCCTLWLLQDPMGRHGPAATAPLHTGGSREGREKQPSPGTTRRAGGVGQPGQQWCPQGDRIGQLTDNPWLSATAAEPNKGPTHALQPTEARFTAARKGARSAALLTSESQPSLQIPWVSLCSVCC